MSTFLLGSAKEIKTSETLSLSVQRHLFRTDTYESVPYLLDSNAYGIFSSEL